MGIQFEQRDDLPAAEEAYRTADDLGHATAAVNLGVLLEERDDFDGAEQAFRRADERGDATGAFHLAWLLQEGGDLAGAEDAYRRAEMRGHPGAHANRRMLRAERSNGAATVRAANGAVTATGPAPPDQEPPNEEPPDEEPVEEEPLDAEPPNEELLDEEPVEEEPLDDERFAEERPARPAHPQVGEAAAEALTAAVATSAIAGEPPFVDPAGADQLASELSRQPATPTGRGRAGRRAGAAAAAATAAREHETKPSRASRFMRRTFRIGLPVAAFAAAFILGAAGRPRDPAPAHLATAASRTGVSATVARVTPVPTPSKLVVVKHRTVHKTNKPAIVHHTAAVTHSAMPAAHPPPAAAPAPTAPASSAVTTSSGSGGSSVSTNGTGTASGSG